MLRYVATALLGLPLLTAAVAARAQEPPDEPPGPQAPAPSPSATPGSIEAPPTPEAPPVDPYAPLDPAERDTLLRLAWRTLVGHLTKNPIQDTDLAAFDLTPRLQGRRGCFVTLKKGGQARGLQGEIEPTRPLYQQVIVFTRRAATRDPRFLPLTDRDLGDLVVEIAVIGRREKVEAPAAIRVGEHGVFLEKWGRRALFLPELPTAQSWTPERTLEELCRQASLPAGAWSQGARLEVFTTEIVAGPQPPPPPPPASPAPEAAPVPPADATGAPSGGRRTG